MPEALYDLLFAHKSSTKRHTAFNCFHWNITILRSLKRQVFIKYQLEYRKNIR